jgi:hypothetical protein
MTDQECAYFSVMLSFAKHLGLAERQDILQNAIAIRREIPRGARDDGMNMVSNKITIPRRHFLIKD